MTISSTLSFFVALASIRPAHVSFSAHPEDMEGSGYDLGSYGSGAGHWSEQGEMKTIKDHFNSEDVTIFAANSAVRAEKTFHVPNYDNTYWPARDSESGFVIVANSKHFLERKEIFAGVIAGGVIGLILAASLATILIYKWQNKDDDGYFLGQQRASDEDYHKSNREEVV